MSLKNKRIVILGGSSGIGLAIAKSAAREGARMVIVGSRQARVDAALAALPEGAEGHAVDLTRGDNIRDLFERLGAFDHLVFTAGETLTLGPLAEVDLAAAQQAFVLRYWGALAAVKYGSAHLRPGGSITLTSGVAKDRPRAGWSIAASICGANEALVRALAVELAPLRVNAVSPGVVRTDLWRNMSEEARDAMYRDIGARLPTGKVGEAEEVARAYLFLMQEGFGTGQTVTVDGGAVLV